MPANETLHVKYRVLRVGGRLVLRRVAYEAVAIGGEGDVGRGDPIALLVGADFDTVVAPNSNAGVGGSEVDADAGGG
mgnify:FL=1